MRAAKSGPDYIDLRFHEAACGNACVNLDAWAMKKQRIRALAQSEIPLIIEGAMGLFDGAPPDGDGATADLARILGLPVVLIVDASHMAQSIAAVVRGFSDHDPETRVMGVILNKVGSSRHERMLRRALTPLGLPILGAVYRTQSITMPSRHLGLVQAAENPDLNAFLDHAADVVEAAIDLDQLCDLMRPLPVAPVSKKMPPPAQNIAIAHDAAFAFSYPHILGDWRQSGASLILFSPLNNEPVPDCDFVFLPGGYPELHAAQLAQADRFLSSLINAAQHSDIYGECGGYMVLGNSITDADGNRHNMAGLLNLDTSFASRKLHLGYRSLTPLGGVFSQPLNGHEFHYSTELFAQGDPLFKSKDAEGQSLPDMGLISGRVSGSYAHVIDVA